MGSYISIHNDTPDVWMVRVRSDEAAISISAMTAGAVGTLAAVVATAGAAAPLMSALAANGVVSIIGLSVPAMAGICTAATAISGISYVATAAGWASAGVVLLTDKLKKDGYTMLKPGAKPPHTQPNI